MSTAAAHRRGPASRLSRALPLLLSAALALTGCATASERLNAQATSGSETPTTARPTVSVASLTVVPPTGALDVDPDAPVTVNVQNGQLRSVLLTGPAGPVPGTLSPDFGTWTGKGPLALGATYTLTADAVDVAGVDSTTRSTFTTLTPARANTVDVSMSPLEGETVGIGMPVVLYFSDPIADDRRAAVEERVSVSSTPDVAGGWHWINDEELHWRPRDLWPPGTQVSVDVDIEGVRAGDQLWGGKPLNDRPTRTFSITEVATRSVVDLAAHTLTVFQDDVAVNIFSITGGKPGWETRNGTKVVLELNRREHMDAGTLGIDPGDPDYYSLNVEYALRVTWSGEFLHAAPWSEGSQGSANVSHGCVGLQTSDAAWLFDRSTRGDVVTVVNSPRPLEKGNGYTDWNYDWDEWLAGSALFGVGPSTIPATTIPG